MPLSSHRLVLTYHFGEYNENQSLANDHNALSGAAIILATENNSVQISPDLPQDGEITLVKSALGMASYVFTKPQKHIFLQGQEGCRNQPFNEIIMEKLADEIKNECPKACQPYSFGKHLDNILGNLESCGNQTETECFQQLLRNYDAGNVKKACTKIHYVVDDSKVKAKKGPNGQFLGSIPVNQAIFRISFSPPAKVSVKEEYLVYDAVAMISSLGGTLGLFVGFSFGGLTSWLLERLRLIVCKAKKHETHKWRK